VGRSWRCFSLPVVTVIRLMGDRGADPYSLIGVPVEGTAHTLFNHIPAERQTNTAEALVTWIWDQTGRHRMLSLWPTRGWVFCHREIMHP
jgi:hypothetical protein